MCMRACVRACVCVCVCGHCCKEIEGINVDTRSTQKVETSNQVV